MRTPLVFWLLAALLLGLTPRLAAAPSHEAEALRAAKVHFQRASEAKKAGRFTEAVAEYSAAYGLVPRPDLLFNIAQAHRLAGNDERAIEFYDKYLAKQPNGPGATEARQWLTLLRPKTLPPPAVPPPPSPVPSTETASATEVAASTPRPVDPTPKPLPTATETRPTSEGKSGAAKASGTDQGAAVVAAPPPPAQPAKSRAWIWGLGAGAGVLVIGALGIGLGVGLPRDPSPSLGRAVIEGL